MHAKQENPKLIHPPALSPAYSIRQNFIVLISLSSVSMKPNDVSMLLSNCLNSHRDYQQSRKRSEKQKPESQIAESRKIVLKPTGVRWNPQIIWLHETHACWPLCYTHIIDHSISFYPDTHCDLLISSTHAKHPTTWPNTSRIKCKHIYYNMSACLLLQATSQPHIHCDTHALNTNFKKYCCKIGPHSRQDAYNTL